MNSYSGKTPDSLSTLRTEMILLTNYCHYQEKLIGLKVDQFKNNYPRILGASLLPYDETKNMKVSGLLDNFNEFISKLLPGFFEGRYLPGMVLKLVQVLMINLFSKRS